MVAGKLLEPLNVLFVISLYLSKLEFMDDGFCLSTRLEEELVAGLLDGKRCWAGATDALQTTDAVFCL